MFRPIVILESPYSGDVEANTQYARRCMKDSIVNHGESPFASHLLYTQCLDDTVPEERKLGMEAGFAWYQVADKCVVYTDRGISRGMEAGIQRAKENSVPVIYRTLSKN